MQAVWLRPLAAYKITDARESSCSGQMSAQLKWKGRFVKRSVLNLPNLRASKSESPGADKSEE